MVEFNSLFPHPPSRHPLAMWPAFPHLKQSLFLDASFRSTLFVRLTNHFGVIGLPTDPPLPLSCGSYFRFGNLCFPPPKVFSNEHLPFVVSGRLTSLASPSRITTSSSSNIVVGSLSRSQTFRRMFSSKLARNDFIISKLGLFLQEFCFIVIGITREVLFASPLHGASRRDIEQVLVWIAPHPDCPTP